MDHFDIFLWRHCSDGLESSMKIYSKSTISYVFIYSILPTVFLKCFEECLCTLAIFHSFMRFPDW